MAKMKELPLPKNIQFFLKRLHPGNRREREEMKDNDVEFGKYHSNDFVIKDARVANYHGVLNYGIMDGIEGWYLCNFDKKFGTFYDGVNIGDKDVLVHPGVPIRLTEDASSTFFLEVNQRECKPSSSSACSIYVDEQMAGDNGDDIFMETNAFDVKYGASGDFGHNIAKNSDDALVEGTPDPISDVTNVSNARKRKSEVALDYTTPKRRPGKVESKKKKNGDKENDGETGSGKVILEKKLHPLKPYLDEIEASDDLIKSLNGTKKNISVDFMSLIMKSFGDRDSCIPGDGKNLIRVNGILNQLIRARKTKDNHHCNVASKIIILHSCSMKENCINIFHREFEADPDEPKPIKIGKYVFGRGGRDVSWRCIDCYSHQESLRRHGKPYDLFGYLQRNPTTGNLEDKKRLPGTDVDPEMPGGLPHVCGGKGANNAEIKVQKSEAAIKKKTPTIKERMEKFEKEIDALVKDADETSFSSELKNLLEKFRGAFGFDSNHRRYFVYFITYSGKKDILYYGITSNPTGRLYRHKSEIFSKDVKKNKKVLQMHLIPFGTINMKYAGEFETAFIRLSKNMRLKKGMAPNRNESNGNYSKDNLLKPIIEAEDSCEYNLLGKCLDELIQVTYIQGNSILSSDVSYTTEINTNQMKRRLSGHVQIVKNAKESKPSSSSARSPLNFDTLPKELQEFLDKLKNTFKFMKGDTKYFIYFFTYKDEPGVIYYGITTNPDQRWDWHKRKSDGPMFEIFKQKRKLQMHVIPLGDIDCMLAAELETILIRLSKREYLNDGNVSLNPGNGYYSSIYSFNEEIVLSGDGEAFDALVTNLNDLIAATIGSKNFISK